MAKQVPTKTDGSMLASAILLMLAGGTLQAMLNRENVNSVEPLCESFSECYFHAAACCGQRMLPFDGHIL